MTTVPPTPPAAVAPAPSPRPAPLFTPLSCVGNAADFGGGRAAIYFVCKSKDGKVFAGQVPLGEVQNLKR